MMKIRKPSGLFSLLPRRSRRSLSSRTQGSFSSPFQRAPLTTVPAQTSHDAGSAPFRQAQPSAGDEIVVAMSGGVDSSVTAALYASQYANVRGIYMANWSQTAKCTEADWNDVQRVCSQLGMPCERVNFEKDYWSDVFLPMVEMYQRGLTPNPDLGCNRHIKFGKMAAYLGLEEPRATKRWLATGHYARVVQEYPDAIPASPECAGAPQYSLARAYERTKDQLYYLASVPRAVLAHVLMPLGHFRKSEVRQLARDRFHLHTAAKPDSVGLCFVEPGHAKFRDFLNEYIPPNPGNIVTEDGRVWGTHQGLWHATIGQRLGISMPQGDPNYKGVWFVSEKRVASNEIIIVRGRDNPALYKQGVRVCDFEWFGSRPSKLSIGSLVMRYQSLHEPVRVRALKEDPGESATIVLHERQRAMAPGQNVVLYDGQKVVASGRISETLE